MSGFRSAAVGGSSNFNPASLVVFGDSITDAGGTLNGGAVDAGVSVAVGKAALIFFQNELTGSSLVGA